MEKKTELLTPDDLVIRERLRNKSSRTIRTKEQLERRKRNLFRNCIHPSILFFEEDLTFRCMKCNKKLIRLASKNEFSLFCQFTGRDPKSLKP